MTTNTTKRRSLRLTLLAGAAALALSACGATGSGEGSSPAPASVTASQPATAAPGSTHSMDPSVGASSTGTAPATATIHIKSFAYTGPDTVPPGTTLTVMNMDSEAHTVTADDGSFDAVVKAGTSATFTAPAKPGAYAYHCTYHSNMQGSLTVK